MRVFAVVAVRVVLAAVIVVDLFVIDACLLSVAGELLAVAERLLEHGQAQNYRRSEARLCSLARLLPVLLRQRHARRLLFARWPVWELAQGLCSPPRPEEEASPQAQKTAHEPSTSSPVDR
jgi:hypothetical protein